MAGSDDRGLDLHLPWGRPPATEPVPGNERPGTGGTGPVSGTAGRTANGERSGPPSAGAATAAGGPATAATVDEGLRRLHRKVGARFDRLEALSAASDAGLEARLGKLEARLEAVHSASVEAVGALAGQVVAWLEERALGVEAALLAGQAQLVAELERGLRERHEQLVVRLEAAEATNQALVGELALVLDADMVNLTQKVHDHASARSAAPDGTPPGEA